MIWIRVHGLGDYCAADADGLSFEKRLGGALLWFEVAVDPVS